MYMQLRRESESESERHVIHVVICIRDVQNVLVIYQSIHQYQILVPDTRYQVCIQVPG